MPRMYSVDGDLNMLDQLLQAAHKHLREKGLKSFSYALVESLKETRLLDYEGFQEKAKPGVFTKGRLFGADAEFRWESRYPDFTFTFFVMDDSPGSIDGFTNSEYIKQQRSVKKLFLWGEKSGSKYTDARIPQDLIYPLSSKYAIIEVEEYWDGWQCIFSRFRRLNESGTKEFQREGG